MEEPDKTQLMNEIELRKDFIKLEDRQKKTDKLILSQRKLVIVTISLLLVILVVMVVAAISAGLPSSIGGSSNAVSMINNFPQSTLISLAQQSLKNPGLLSQYSVYPLNQYGLNATPMFDGSKLEVFYAGSTACQFCARTRIPLSIALAQFGSFSKLYGGYSVGDGNYPTIFWGSNVSDGYVSGTTYSSNYIDFIATDIYEPNGFSSPNEGQTLLAYPDVSPLFTVYNKVYGGNASSDFGTPLMMMGNYILNGAPTSAAPPLSTGGSYFQSFGSQPPQTMTPLMLIDSIYKDNGSYSESEILSADMYIALFCKQLNNPISICKSNESLWSNFYNEYG
jgi:hypothetical protein